MMWRGAIVEVPVDRSTWQTMAGQCGNVADIWCVGCASRHVDVADNRRPAWWTTMSHGKKWRVNIAVRLAFRWELRLLLAVGWISGGWKKGKKSVNELYETHFTMHIVGLPMLGSPLQSFSSSAAIYILLRVGPHPSTRGGVMMWQWIHTV